ncbi:hypothetical protein HHL28_08960 [Aerophototrophica crusticola]|uniref:YhdP central domain-containing protein n=1 Tax=Aerophototrophica crusticola TaxID=1709002 RepID=A0A858R700_9PROT|nr:hypothetical protein HHL28_08960 [Rhodospirillaceae bacterium B3]
MLRRTGIVVLELLAGLLAVLALGGGLLAWRLTQGPLSVGFLTPYVEEALNRDAPARIAIGSTALSWPGFGAPLDIQAMSVTAYGESGAVVASLPALRLGLSLPGLLQGNIAPTRIELVEPRLYGLRTEDGKFRLDIRRDKDDDDDDMGDKLLQELLDALRRPPDPTTSLGALREVRITRGQLELENRQIGVTWRMPLLDLRLRRNANGVRGTAAVDLDLGGKLNRLQSEIEYRAREGTTSIRTALVNLHPADFAPIAPVLAPLTALETDLNGSISLELGPDLAPLTLALGLTGSAGRLVLPEHFPKPVPFDGLDLHGRLEGGGSRFILDKLALDLGKPLLALTGTATRANGQVALALNAELTGMPMAELGRYWPAKASPGARGWMMENLADGSFDRTTFVLEGSAPENDLGAFKETKVRGTFDLSGFTIHYRRPLPPARQVAGTATFDGREFLINIASGKLLDMDAGPGTVRITNLDVGKGEAIDIAVALSGPLSTALTVLDHPPLGYAKKVNLVPYTVKGTAKVDLTFKFPLISNLTMDMVDLRGKAKLSDVAVPDVVADISATRGELDLTVDQKQLQVSGTAHVNGVPAQVEWEENFPEAAKVGTRVRLRLTPDDAGRARFKLDFPDWINGPAPVDMTYTREGSAGKRVETIQADVDLTPATVRIDLLDWRKTPGLPGKGTVTVRFVDGKPILIPAFLVQTGELRAEGRLDLRPADYGIDHLVLERFRLGQSNARIDLRGKPDGSQVVDVRGQSFDIRPFRKDDPEKGKSPPAAEEKPTPLAITFDLDQAIMGDEGQAIRRAVGQLSRTGKAWDLAVLDAQVGEKGTVRVRYGPEGDRLALSIESDDAGAAFREFDVLSQLRGGSLTVVGRSDPRDPKRTVTGEVDIRDYKVQDAPVLARLLSAAGPEGFANFVAGEPLAFSRLSGTFHWHEGGISLREVRTSGSQVGITLEGNLDLDQDTADLQGTVVPFSTVNKLLGAIPLLGEALVGGEGQGLFAATYRMTGPLADLKTSVNPLAVLAPGFLRNLFFLGEPAGEEGMKPEAPKPPERKREGR